MLQRQPSCSKAQIDIGLNVSAKTQQNVAILESPTIFIIYLAKCMLWQHCTSKTLQISNKKRSIFAASIGKINSKTVAYKHNDVQSCNLHHHVCHDYIREPSDV